jgi:hypothetical protein
VKPSFVVFGFANLTALSANHNDGIRSDDTAELAASHASLSFTILFTLRPAGL